MAVGGFRALLTPNPSASGTRLCLDLPKAENIEITVVDVLGRIRFSLETRLPAGESRVGLPADLAAGMYWVRVNDSAGRARVLRWVVE